MDKTNKFKGENKINVEKSIKRPCNGFDFKYYAQARKTI